MVATTKTCLSETLSEITVLPEVLCLLVVIILRFLQSDLPTNKYQEVRVEATMANLTEVVKIMCIMVKT